MASWTDITAGIAIHDLSTSDDFNAYLENMRLLKTPNYVLSAFDGTEGDLTGTWSDSLVHSKMSLDYTVQRSNAIILALCGVSVNNATAGSAGTYLRLFMDGVNALANSARIGGSYSSFDASKYTLNGFTIVTGVASGLHTFDFRVTSSGSGTLYGTQKPYFAIVELT